MYILLLQGYRYGYQAASSGLSNMHNYFDAIYEARYVSGVVAGMKLNEMIKNGDITADRQKSVM